MVFSRKRFDDSDIITEKETCCAPVSLQSMLMYCLIAMSTFRKRYNRHIL